MEEVSTDMEKEISDPDVVPDELMELAKETMTFTEAENVCNDTNKVTITRKRKRQRARSVAVRTLFVSNLPFDATQREIYLLFVRFKGFQGSILKQATKDGVKYNPVAFVMFRKREQAENACVEINGLKYDPASTESIMADFARANTNATKIKKLKRNAWDTDGNNEMSQHHDVAHYQSPMGIPSPEGTPTVVFGTPDEMWCHQQVSPHNEQNPQPPHIVQLPPQLQPTPNFTMVPMAHPPPLIITAPYMPPPINYNHVTTSCCAHGQPVTPENSKKCTLFVANMGMETSEDELTAVFTRVPSFKRLKMLRNKERTPVAFVEYLDHHSACQAKNLFHGKTLFTSSESGGIRIEFAKKPMIEGKWKLNYG